MPIHDACGDVIGVAQAINKLSILDEPFNEKDEKVRSVCVTSRVVYFTLIVYLLAFRSRSSVYGNWGVFVFFVNQKKKKSFQHDIIMYMSYICTCCICSVLSTTCLCKLNVMKVQARARLRSGVTLRACARSSCDARITCNDVLYCSLTRHAMQVMLPHLRTVSHSHKPAHLSLGMKRKRWVTRCCSIMWRQDVVLLLQVFASYLAFCGIGLRNAQMYERSLLENRRNQVCSIYSSLFSIIFDSTPPPSPPYSS